MSFGKKFFMGLGIYCDEKSKNLKPVGITSKTERNLRNAERKNDFCDKADNVMRKWGIKK